MSFYKVVSELTGQAPEIILRKLLEPKLREAGVKAWRSGARALAKHLADKQAGEFHWEDYPDGEVTDVTVEFTEDDGRELERLYDKFEGTLDEAMAKVIDTSVDAMLLRYRSEWQAYRRSEERFIANFRNRLEDRWGTALDGLRLLSDLCKDEGEKYIERLNRSQAKSPPYKRVLLSRLHSRACQVTAEVIALLEAGFAKGAMARWRTLHELEVIATIVSVAGNSTAKRFFDYEYVENKRAKDQYLLDQPDLGLQPLSKKEIDEVEADYAAVVQEHGRDFRHPYGWAAKFLKNKSPRFNDLERAAGVARMRSHYKFASYSVHASPRALTIRIDDLGDQDWPIAGASNAGLEEPGQNAAMTILRITYLLCENLKSIDNAMIMNALIILRDETVSNFAKCAVELADEDAEIRAAVAGHDIEVDTSVI
jgi:hypothetical protein